MEIISIDYKKSCYHLYQTGISIKYALKVLYTWSASYSKFEVALFGWVLRLTYMDACFWLCFHNG